MILLKNNHYEEDEKLFSTGNSELDDILEEVYYSGISDGYDYFQKEFTNNSDLGKRTMQILKDIYSDPKLTKLYRSTHYGDGDMFINLFPYKDQAFSFGYQNLDFKYENGAWLGDMGKKYKTREELKEALIDYLDQDIDMFRNMKNDPDSKNIVKYQEYLRKQIQDKL